MEEKTMDLENADSILTLKVFLKRQTLSLL